MRIAVALWFDADDYTSNEVMIPIIMGMSNNQKIDFLIFTNKKSLFCQALSPNILIIEYDRCELISKINSFFGIQIPATIQSTEFGKNILGAIKPFAPLLFPEIYSTYMLYGWIEYDIFLEPGFDLALLARFADPNIFNIGNTINSSTLQIIRLEDRLLDILSKNRILVNNWFTHSSYSTLRFFDEASLEYSSGLMGFVPIRDIYKGRRSSLRTDDLDNCILIGNGHIASKHPFKICFTNNGFDRSTLIPAEITDKTLKFVEEIKSRNIIWSLDRFFKLHPNESPIEKSHVFGDPSMAFY